MEFLHKLLYLWVAVAVTVVMCVAIWFFASNMQLIENLVSSSSNSEVVHDVVYKDGVFHWMTFHVAETEEGLVTENWTKIVSNDYSTSAAADTGGIEISLQMKDSRTTIRSVRVEVADQKPHGAWEVWFMYEKDPVNPITFFYSHKRLNGTKVTGSVVQQVG